MFPVVGGVFLVLFCLWACGLLAVVVPWCADTVAALATARVAGASGQLAGVDTEAVEALAARAYSVDQGPVAMQGELSIELPRAGEAADGSTGQN